jgi:hypothetical protein
MNKVYFVLGIITFWAIVLFAAGIAFSFIREAWDKYKWNTWLFQCKETFNAWWKWKFRKRSLDLIVQWDFVENLHKGFSGQFKAYGRDYRKHIFRKWWYNFLTEMLLSEEYKRYKLKTDEDYLNY